MGQFTLATLLRLTAITALSLGAFVNGSAFFSLILFAAAFIDGTGACVKQALAPNRLNTPDVVRGLFTIVGLGLAVSRPMPMVGTRLFLLIYHEFKAGGMFSFNAAAWIASMWIVVAWISASAARTVTMRAQATWGRKTRASNARQRTASGSEKAPEKAGDE